MKVTQERLTPTTIKLTIVADQELLAATKQTVVAQLSRNAKVPGFRQGKAPAAMVEKQIDQTALQSEFLEQAVNACYIEALRQEAIRPVASPQISIVKFVPFETVEFSAEVSAIGDIKLADYKTIKLAKKPVKVTAEQIEGVIKDLQVRAADRKPADRASKDGDQVTIDFFGTDAKTNEPISGADGKDYELVLGSNSFIPGFEPNLVGLKAGEVKDFDITFPKEYGVAALQGRKAHFSVTVHKVDEMVEPKVDNDFAAKIGPFKTVDELKADITTQLEQEEANKSQRAFENELLEAIASKSEVAIPDSLVDEEIARLEDEERRNLVYRGQTWEEHLAEEGLSEEEHREKNREPAAARVKAGLILGEVAEAEKIDVTKDELDLRLQLLKGQYTDKAMQAELDKPENRREIASRLVSEKTIAKLTEYAISK